MLAGLLSSVEMAEERSPGPGGSRISRRLDGVFRAPFEHGVDQPVLACRLYEIRGIRSITRNAARHSQLFKRDVTSVVCQYHGQRRRTALNRLHLQNGRRAHVPTLGARPRR